MKSKQVICKSGLRGSQYKLQDSYVNFNEFKAFCRGYGVHKRLGYSSMKAAWESNPTIQSSTNPSDLSIVYFHAVKGKKSLRVKESTEKDCSKVKGSMACFVSRGAAIAQLNATTLE